MNQSNRKIKIIELLSTGRSLTVSDLYRYFGEQISLRTIQRDLKQIQESGIPLDCQKTKNNMQIWQLSRDYKNLLKPIFSKNHLLSLHLLKSYLKGFEGTSIDNSIKELIWKIEDQAPGDVIEDMESLLVNQVAGSMDYRAFNQILDQVINAIADKKWVTITYQNLSDHSTKSYHTFLQRLFFFNNSLYVIVYFPKYDEHHALAIHKIQHISTAKDQTDLVPDFDVDEFKKQRFGVFSGKTEHVVLEIQPEYVKWFANREWHPSQILRKSNDGKLWLEMDVPLSRDFITWVLGWHDGIKVIKPNKLIQIIKRKLLDNFNLYKEK